MSPKRLFRALAFAEAVTWTILIVAMGAGETYQELHTGQKGLQDSVIESIQESEVRPSRIDGDDR